MNNLFFSDFHKYKLLLKADSFFKNSLLLFKTKIL